MNIRFIFYSLCAAVGLLGCATTDNIAERVSLADQIAAQHQFTKLNFQAGRFELIAWMGPQKRSGILHIYIEGDGLAWLTRFQPSANPTPRDPIALHLAIHDGQDVAYLARPCQYIRTRHDECQERYWTSDRFAPEVIEAMNAAVTHLKEKSGAAQLVLIGYSGGGAVAALIAAKRTDVSQLVTVAGNLDHLAWARLHGISELKGSLNPVDAWQAIANIRQTHFIGERDRIVPIEVYRSYRQAFPKDANIRAEIVPGIDHSCCWADMWPTLLKMLP